MFFIYEIRVAGFQLFHLFLEIRIPGTTCYPNILNAAVRMLRLHLVLERLFFPISPLLQCIF